MPTIEERLALLEHQQSLQTAALARIVEGDWTGDPLPDGQPSAAALVVALNGGQPPADWKPLACPKP